MSGLFDGRGLKCPLAFVKAKQHLIKKNTKIFLLDDDVSLSDFIRFLEQSGVNYNQERDSKYVMITLRHDG